MVLHRTIKSILLVGGTVVMFFCLFAMQAQGQIQISEENESALKTNTDMMDSAQCKNFENNTIELYEAYLEYPQLKYTFNYDTTGSIESVHIEGVDDADYQKSLSAALIELELLRKGYMDIPSYSGIYFITETIPQPKEGIEAFRNKLHDQLTFPEEAKNAGLEGTVFVRFIVNPDGTITQVSSVSNFDKDHYLVEEMEKQAEQAITSTSGDWIPAKVGSMEVSSWRMLPVEFTIEENPTVFPYF